MRRHGTLKRWNDDRGFGFIEPNEGPPEVFVHITGYQRRTDRPQVNERVTFEIEPTANGKKRAVDVRLLGASQADPELPTPPGLWKLLAIPLFLLVALGFAPRSPELPLLLIGYLIASAICLIVYASDKAAAQRGDWRVSESTLLLLGLAGGWPGALLAQCFLRHKTRKASFQNVFWITVLINIIGFFYLTGRLQKPPVSIRAFPVRLRGDHERNHRFGTLETRSSGPGNRAAGEGPAA